MPPKRSKKIPTTSIKQGNIKQVVNVRVGDQTSKTRRRKPRPRTGGGGGGRGGGGDSGLAMFSRPAISLSLQAPTLQQPSYLNEYNMLLREIANERRQRESNAPPLQPNTTPLTINQQRNELLSKVAPKTQLDPITERFSQLATQTVNKEVYDDPQTNENMFTSPPSLAYNVSQKLPVSTFDEEDVIKYDNENSDEQEELEIEVGGSESEGGGTRKQKLTEITRLNITQALNELGLTTNKKDNAEKQKLLRQALGDSYVEGRQPSKYTKITDLEKIASYLRNEIRKREMRAVGKGQGQEVFAMSGMKK